MNTEDIKRRLEGPFKPISADHEVKEWPYTHHDVSPQHGNNRKKQRKSKFKNFENSKELKSSDFFRLDSYYDEYHRRLSKDTRTDEEKKLGFDTMIEEEEPFIRIVDGLNMPLAKFKLLMGRKSSCIDEIDWKLSRQLPKGGLLLQGLSKDSFGFNGLTLQKILELFPDDDPLRRKVVINRPRRIANGDDHCVIIFPDVSVSDFDLTMLLTPPPVKVERFQKKDGTKLRACKLTYGSSKFVKRILDHGCVLYAGVEFMRAVAPKSKELVCRTCKKLSCKFKNRCKQLRCGKCGENHLTRMCSTNPQQQFCLHCKDPGHKIFDCDKAKEEKAKLKKAEVKRKSPQQHKQQMKAESKPQPSKGVPRKNLDQVSDLLIRLVPILVLSVFGALSQVLPDLKSIDPNLIAREVSNAISKANLGNKESPEVQSEPLKKKKRGRRKKKQVDDEIVPSDSKPAEGSAAGCPQVD